MSQYKYKLSEQAFKPGDVKQKGGVKTTVKSVDPETGAVSWDVEYVPAFDSVYDDFNKLRKSINALDIKTDDAIIDDIAAKVKKEFNRYRTYIRKNYPEYYKKFQSNPSVDEISTSGGAGGYLTKYAFRLPKGHKKVEEGIGASLGPGPKAGPKGVKDNYYVKAFGYKLVDRKKQAKASKTMDYRDLWGKTYD